MPKCLGRFCVYESNTNKKQICRRERVKKMIQAIRTYIYTWSDISHVSEERKKAHLERIKNKTFSSFVALLDGFFLFNNFSPPHSCSTSIFTFLGYTTMAALRRRRREKYQRRTRRRGGESFHVQWYCWCYCWFCCCCQKIDTQLNFIRIFHPIFFWEFKMENMRGRYQTLQHQSYQFMRK